MIPALAVRERNTSIATEGGCNKVSKKILLAVSILIFITLSLPAYSSNLMDSSSLRVPFLNEMNMSRILPDYSGTGVFVEPETLGYDLRRMRQMNPDFTTYPEETGIIWQKKTVYSRSENGGIDVTRLYVILGRSGFPEKWLTWNIQTPNGGSTQILDASAYNFMTLAKISEVRPEEDLDAGVKTLRFSGLPETFIISVSWRETLPEILSFEGMIFLQEDLRVWEASVEVNSPQRLSNLSFPERITPEIEELGEQTVYKWRKINIDPYDDSREMARLQRIGIAFSSKQGSAGIQAMIKDALNTGGIKAPPEALSGFKRSKDAGTAGLIDWLMAQPEITFAEGSPRRIPSSGAWTKREKLLLAKSWLSSKNVDANIFWQIPFDPSDRSPLCQAMFTKPMLDVQKIQGITFHDMRDPDLVGGLKVFGLSSDGKLFPRRIPSSKSSENRLSAIMDLQLTEQGIMSGTVKIIPRGAWRAFLLDNSSANEAVLSLFPGLTNYKNVSVKNVKGVSEISFTIDKKPGIGGTGRGILAIIPFFEPVFVRKLGSFEPPVEIRFPFIIDQNITLLFPKNAKEAMISGKIEKNPDRINFSSNYQNRRHRLIAEARFELNMQSVSPGNMSLLLRSLEDWRIFSSKNIPIRQ